jgi:hypothetical protein
MAGLKSREYKEKCSELDLEIMEERRQKQDLALVHKLMQDGQDASIFQKLRETKKVQEKDKWQQMDWPHSMFATMSESAHLQCELWKNGSVYLRQSGQLQAKRPSNVSLGTPESNTATPRWENRKKMAQRQVTGGKP